MAFKRGISVSPAAMSSIQPSPRHHLNVVKLAVDRQFLTPTLRRSRSPSSHSNCSGQRQVQSASRNSLQPPSTSFLFTQRSSPSSPRNIQDRLIPCRSQTDMKLAQHLLSPMSHAFRRADEQQENGDGSGGHQVTRILNFGTTQSVKATAQPLSLVTSSQVLPGFNTTTTTTANHKSVFKIPTKPDRVMAAPGTFLECGFQSSHWAPSANLVVALESGIYVCKINEDCKVSEIRNNMREVDYPFCFVLWNSDGNEVVCAKMNGQIQIVDLRHPHRTAARWQLNGKHDLRSVAFEHDHLLTCGTAGNNGVRIYDVRQRSAAAILSLKSRSTVNCLSWSPNGHLLAAGCQSGVTYLWDVRQPTKEMALLKTQEKNPVQAVGWCPWRPSLLLSGSSFPRPTICIQNTATDVLVGESECASEVTGIQFNGQLKQVATSHHASLPDGSENQAIHGTENSVQLWQLGTNKMIPVLELEHEEGIVSMAASVNSDQLLTLGVDELLCLWQWNEPGGKHPATQAGFQTARSQLDTFNLIR